MSRNQMKVLLEPAVQNDNLVTGHAMESEFLNVKDSVSADISDLFICGYTT